MYAFRSARRTTEYDYAHGCTDELATYAYQQNSMNVVYCIPIV